MSELLKTSYGYSIVKKFVKKAFHNYNTYVYAIFSVLIFLYGSHCSFILLPAKAITHAEMTLMALASVLHQDSMDQGIETVYTVNPKGQASISSYNLFRAHPFRV